MSMNKCFFSIQVTALLILFFNAMLLMASDFEMLPTISVDIPENVSHKEYLGLVDSNSTKQRYTSWDFGGQCPNFICLDREDGKIMV